MRGFLNWQGLSLIKGNEEEGKTNEKVVVSYTILANIKQAGTRGLDNRHTLGLQGGHQNY